MSSASWLTCLTCSSSVIQYPKSWNPFAVAIQLLSYLYVAISLSVKAAYYGEYKKLNRTSLKKKHSQVSTVKPTKIVEASDSSA